MDANAVKALVKLIKSAKRGILIIAGGASDGAAAALAAADVASTVGVGRRRGRGERDSNRSGRGYRNYRYYPLQ